ncbi:actin [Tieghemostelium lacteum]|uniref:Actin n=1 Tax=Tieghemostelium lacteum TaxID=361077 RepID=A0A151Z7D8_TIELA|nr:actin [Tieghemostelium lacteum]|eukprot:KYQ89879.1 actin [Tieghemostelium lacteum]
MTDSPLNSKSNRERMTEILFEKFNVPSLHICNSAVASMFASGLSNGIVLDSGDGCTHVVPVYDGYSLPHAILPFEISGKDLTNHLVKLLMEKDFAFTTTSEKLLVRDIKEKLAYVALDYNQELKGNEKDIEKTYELPDGTDLSIGNHRFRCTEPLFKSELLNSNSSGGIHELIHNSILKCNGDLRKDMYSNILLSGGNTMIDRLSERLKHEITLLAPPGTTVNIISPPDRSFSTWIGASMLASSESFQQKLITKKEYKEYGATIIHQKCF